MSDQHVHKTDGFEARPKNSLGRHGKKPYRAPQLTVFGSVKDLVKGGSGNANESSSGRRKRP